MASIGRCTGFPAKLWGLVLTATFHANDSGHGEDSPHISSVKPPAIQYTAIQYTAVRYLALAIISAVLLLAAFRELVGSNIGATDFVQYWGSARVLVTGGNPYDPEQLWPLERSVAPQLTEPIRMWNPPAMLLFGLPFSFMSFDMARAVWWFLLVGAAVLAFQQGAELLRLETHERRWGMALLLACAPLHSALGLGQLSPLLLLAWVLALRTIDARPMLSGLLLAITVLKPHLLFLVYVALFLQRRYRVLLFAASGAVVLSAAPLIFRPQVYAWYGAAFGEPPLYWFTPTAGAWLQNWFEQGVPHTDVLFRMAIRSIPSCAAIGVLLCRFGRAEHNLVEQLLRIVPWSLLMSPYGWTFDQLLLVPSMLLVLRNSLRSERCDDCAALMILGAATVIEALPLGPPGHQYTVWFPLVIGVLCARSAAGTGARLCRASPALTCSGADQIPSE